MNSATFVKYAAIASLSGFIMACSSTPKVVQPEPELAAAAPEPVQIVNTARGPSLTVNDVLFDFEQASLRPQAKSIVAKAARYLKDNPERTALIEGHTDHTGDESYNQMLSDQRSVTIKDALVAQGVSANRIKTLGMGETQPVADNLTPAGRQANRRVEIVFQRSGFES